MGSPGFSGEPPHRDVTWNCAGTARPAASVTVKPSVDLIPADLAKGTPEVTGSECRATPERFLTVSSIERPVAFREHIAPTVAPTAVETRSMKTMASEVFFFNAIFPEVLDLYLEYRQNQRCYEMRCPLARPVMTHTGQIYFLSSGRIFAKATPATANILQSVGTGQTGVE